MEVHFFLTDAGTGKPALPEGVQRDAAVTAAKGRPAEPRAEGLPKSRVLADEGADPGELDKQRWGVVAPRGQAGTDLLDAIKSLVQKRAQDQGAEVQVYEVDPGMSASQTDDWLRNEYQDKVGRSAAALPRNLLILGGPEQISWAMQQQLAASAMVGRLAFQDADGRADLEGYEAYVAKVLKWESDRAKRDPRVILYGVPDGTQATRAGREHLLVPNLRLLQQPGGPRDVESIGVDGPPAPNAAALEEAGARMLEAARGEASILFSVSHGAGGAKWASPAAQRSTQGALAFGERLLGLTDVGQGSFLPGGVWFFFACFSAGTPGESLYRPWVAKLHELGCFAKTPQEMVLSAPVDGAPFVAALPQAALRNEQGPLAVVGHVDLALSFSFLKEDYTSAGRQDKPYPERFAGLLRSLVLGRRMGVAFEGVARGFRELDSALASRYAVAEGATEAPAGPARDDERASLAALWLERQDLRSFVILGDPAVRLSLGDASDPWAAAEAAARSAARGETPSLGGALDPWAAAASAAEQTTQAMERAVLSHLRGASLQDVAAGAGVSEGEVQRWVDAFLTGAREGLAKLRE